MKTIIVPTDFSDASVNAAFYALEIALKVQADVLLLHILPLPLTVSEVPLPLDSYEIALEQSNKSLEELKEKLGNYCNNILNITCLASTANFQEEIRNSDGGDGPFAVIMGTSGAGATEAFLLGSFSFTAAKHLKFPLIVVPPHYIYKNIEKVGLACDMDNVLDHIPIKGIRSIFENFSAKMEVLYVTKPSERMSPEILRESKFIQICLAGYHPKISIITSDDISEGLEEFADKNDIDLIMVSPKERNFIKALFHKSLTRKMVLHPKVPVMFVHS